MDTFREAVRQLLIDSRGTGRSSEAAKAESRGGGPPLPAEILATRPLSRIAKSAYKKTRPEESFRFRDGLLHACWRRMDGIDKRIVYILRSDADPSRHYVGITSNVRDRLHGAVPVQPVPYEGIVSLARRHNDGVGAAKAAAIGVVSGVGTFLASSPAVRLIAARAVMRRSIHLDIPQE